MTVTPTTLVKAAGAAAVAAGLIFIGVNIGHPHLDVESVTTTDVIVRNALKVLMAALALAGITGMYLSQVRRNALLGLVGYVVFAVGYLALMIPPYIGAFVLPTLAATQPEYVDDLLAASSGRPFDGDIGAIATVLQVQGFAYLAGGVLFGIALFRARVLTRWATLLLAASGLISAALSVMPDAFYRFLAYPNGIAMVVLGYSLWTTTRTTSDQTAAHVSGGPQLHPAGAE